jgi:hypothetical protein
MGTEAPGRWRRRRWRARVYVEAGCDAIFWVTGLAVAAWGGGDLQGNVPHALRLTCAVLAVCVMSVASGLLSGAYGRRYRRGMLDEVLSVCVTGGLMLMALNSVSGALIGGQRAAAQTVAAGALFALAAMVAARTARRASARMSARSR